MKQNTFSAIKKLLKIFISLALFSIALILISYFLDNKVIKDIKEFTKSGTKVLYISEKKNYSEKPIELLKKYEVEYEYINSSNFSSIEKKKLTKIIRMKDINNVIVIYKDGKVLDTLHDFESNESLIKFFQKNGIFPEVIGKVDGILESVTEAINTDYTLIYLPYNYAEGVELQDEILNNICKKYKIKYKLINAYLLSEFQKEKINTILQVSKVENQIIILVKNNEIVGSIRNVYDEKAYIEELVSSKFIDLSKKSINYLDDYNVFNEIIKSQEKNIITIGRDDCKYCDDVIDKLNEIGNKHEINIYYINIGTIDSDLSIKIINKLKELEYSEGFTTPLTLIVESDKIIDYIIGASDEEYFVDVLIENGLIRGEQNGL